MEPSALAAVASKPRRRILRLVLDREMNAGELAAHFQISWPAVSQHLGVLRRAGLIVERREGRRRIYSTDRRRLGPLHAVLEEMWSTDLDRLAQLAEAEESEES
jgi:DNA-binding transcriptional ArsR family regulator